MKKLILGLVLMLSSFMVNAASVTISPTLTSWGGYTTGLQDFEVFQLSQDSFSLGQATVELTTSLNDWSFSLYSGTDVENTNSLILSGGTILSNVKTSFTFSMIGGEIYSLMVSGSRGDNPSFTTAFTLPVEVSEVPLPAAVWLFGSVLLGGLAMRRRSQKMNAQAVAA